MYVDFYFLLFHLEECEATARTTPCPARALVDREVGLVRSPPGAPPAPALHASAGERAEPGAAHLLISAAREARGLWAGFAAWEVLVVTSRQMRHLPLPAGTAERGFPPVPLVCPLSSLRALPTGLATSRGV